MACLCTLYINLNAQALTCNDHINVSVNHQCAVDLTTDAFLEGDVLNDADYMNGLYTYKMYYGSLVVVTGDNTGPTMGGDDMSNYINKVLTFKVFYNGNANYCGGTMLIEDKIAPAIICDCPVGGNGMGAYDPDCSGICYELELVKNKYWDRITDQIVPSDIEDIIDNSVEDNCGNIDEYDVSYYDTYVDLGNCEGTLLRRHWTIFAGHPFGTSCVKEYYFERLGLDRARNPKFINTSNGLQAVPIRDSLIWPKRIVEIPTCGVANDPASIAAYFDNPLTKDQDSDNNGADPHELDVDCVIENNEGIWYAYPHYYVNGRNPSGPHAQPIHADQVCTLLSGYSDTVLEACAPGCYGNSKTLRTWTVMDWCTGLFINYEQIIKIVDGEGPVLYANDVNVSVDPWDCKANVHMEVPEHLFDECDNIVNYWIGGASGGQTVSGNAQSGYIVHDLPVGSHIVQYIAQDCCGNLSSINVNVNVIDQTPPVAISKEFIVTSLTNIGNQGDPNSGLSKIFAKDFDNGSYDGCTNVQFQVRRKFSPCFPEDTVWGDFVRFCCEDLNGQGFVEVPVHLKVVDWNNNVNAVWSAVRLEDKSTPNVFCPQSMIVNCDMDLNDFSLTGWPEGVSACGEFVFDIPQVEVIDNTEPRNKPANVLPLYDIDGDNVPDMVPAYNKSCGFGAVIRRFRQGNSLVCEQWFVVESVHQFDPNTIVFPRDKVVNCNGFDAGEPTFESSVCKLIGISLESDTFVSEPGSCMKILNHWSVIDWCNYNPNSPFDGGRWNHTQVIKLEDLIDPILEVQDSLVFAADAECISKGIPLSAIGTDEGECGSDWLRWEVDVDLYSDWISDYTYSNKVPRFIDGDPNPFYLPKSGNGEEVTILLPQGIPSSKKWHRVVWQVFDGCNNRVSQTKYFQITDLKAPTPYCLNISSAFMENGEVELWAIDFDVNSFDNCSDEESLIFTFTDILPPPRDDSEYDSTDDFLWYDGTFWYYDSTNGNYQDQDDYGGEVHSWNPGLRSSGKIFTPDDLDSDGIVYVPIYVWDECGNKDFCTVTLRVVDNDGGGVIAGKIVTEAGENVSGIMTQVEAAMPGYPKYYMTDDLGEYAFSEAPFNIDYSISGSSEDNYLNGVSTLDLVLIQRHILGQESLSSAYKMIAADINNDKTISALDLLDLRKLILGIYNKLPENVSWKTVVASQALTTSNPWVYNDAIEILSLDDNKLAEDFIAVKIGDVNGTVQLLKGQQQLNTRAEPLQFEFIDSKVKKGERISLTISTSAEQMFAYQLTLDFGGMQFLSIEGDNVNESNVAQFDNQLAISCHALTALNKDNLLTLHLIATSDGNLSDFLSINSDLVQAEAYVGENLATQSVALKAIKTESIFKLLQNTPNPFSKETSIVFQLPETGDVNLSFYDLTGKLIYEVNDNFEAGVNNININASDLGVTGMVIYKMQTQDATASKSMIVFE